MNPIKRELERQNAKEIKGLRDVQEGDFLLSGLGVTIKIARILSAFEVDGKFAVRFISEADIAYKMTESKKLKIYRSEQTND